MFSVFSVFSVFSADSSCTRMRAAVHYPTAVPPRVGVGVGVGDKIDGQGRMRLTQYRVQYRVQYRAAGRMRQDRNR